MKQPLIISQHGKLLESFTHDLRAILMRRAARRAAITEAAKKKLLYGVVGIDYYV